MTTGGEARSSSEAIGILFGRDTLHGCRAAQTLFGNVRYQHASVSVINGDIDAALKELLAEVGAAKQPLPIAAAIPTDECYFATRPIASGATNASPRVLLRESLRSSSARLEQMAIDVINWQPDRRLVAGIVAAPIDRVEAIRAAVGQTQHSLQRLEPAAASLIAVAPEREGRERRNSLTTRVLLGESSMLAVMSRGVHPIHWQRLPLPAGDEATGIVSAIRALETAASACGLDRTPDTVVVHGRRELQSLIDQQWLTDNLQNDFRWVETPALLGDDIARALAERLLANEDEGFDFVRQHRDPLQLRRVVPYKEIFAYVAAACVLGGVLWTRLGSVHDQHTALVTTAPPMIGGGTNPQPEKDRLNARAASVSQFLEGRVLWSGLLADVTNELPEGMRLTGIRGSAPMTKLQKKQVQVSPTTLVLRAECALGEDGSMPKSLNSLAESLESIESVAEHFDNVELSDLRRMTSQDTGVQGAEFSVVFTTKTKGGR